MIELSELSPGEATTLVKANVGGKVLLAKDYMTHKTGSEWVIKSCNTLGGTCVIAVSPPSGGKGFFAPYLHFRLVADAPAPVVEEPVAEPATPEPVINPDLPIEIRGEFELDGFDSDAPLYEAFFRVAPNTDTARELFLTYANDYSEFDTEFLDDLLRAAKVRPGAHWSDTNVTQMLMLLNEVQKDEPSTEDEIGTTVAEHFKRMGVAPVPAAPPEALLFQPASSPDLDADAKPAVFIHPDVKPAADAPKRRGRPPGSRNKPVEPVAAPAPQPAPEPTPQPAVRVVEEPVLARALDNLPPAAPEGRHFSDYLEPEVREVKPASASKPVFAPSPIALELAANLLLSVGVDEQPELLLDQVVGIVRRALLLDD